MAVEIRGLSEEARQRLQSLRSQSQRAGRRDVDVGASDGFADVFAAIAATRIEVAEPAASTESEPAEEAPVATDIAPVQADASRPRETEPDASVSEKSVTEAQTAEVSDKPEPDGEAGEASVQTDQPIASEVTTEDGAVTSVVETDVSTDQGIVSSETVEFVEAGGDTERDSKRRRTPHSESASQAEGAEGFPERTTAEGPVKPELQTRTSADPTVDAELPEAASPELSAPETRRSERAEKPSIAPREATATQSSSAEAAAKSSRPTGSEPGSSTARGELYSADIQPAASAKPNPAAAAASVQQSGSAATTATNRSANTSGRPNAVSPTTSVRGKPTDVAEAQRPASTDNRGQLDRMARIRLIHRISRAFDAMGKEGGRIRMRLAPNELGSVQVDMRVKNKTVDATVIAESESAAAILREHLPELRSRLEKMDLQVERLDIELDSDGLDDRPRSHSDSGDHRGFDRASSRGTRPAAVDRATSTDSSSPAARIETLVANGGSDWRF